MHSPSMAASTRGLSSVADALKFSGLTRVEKVSAGTIGESSRAALRKTGFLPLLGSTRGYDNQAKLGIGKLP